MQTTSPVARDLKQEVCINRGTFLFFFLLAFTFYCSRLHPPCSLPLLPPTPKKLLLGHSGSAVKCTGNPQDLIDQAKEHKPQAASSSST